MSVHGWIILDKPLGLGSTQAVGQPVKDGPFVGAHDPRSREGRAAGF